MKQLLPHYQKLSLLALAVFLLLVVLQSLWLQKAVRLQQEEMQLQVRQIIPEIAMALYKQSPNAFKKTQLSFHELEMLKLKNIVHHYLDSIQIDFATHFSIYHETKSNLFISDAPNLKKELIASDIRACMSCIISFSVVDQEAPQRSIDETEEAYYQRINEGAQFSYFAPVQELKKEDKIYLTMYQPHAFGDALQSMMLLFGISLVLLLILLYLFYHLLTLLSNYRILAKLKEDFFNNVTHEFKTPLSSIRLASRVLRQNKNPEKNNTYYDLIERESKALEIQVDKLLELSLLDNDVITLEKEPLDLHMLLEAIPDRLQPLLQSHKGQLHLNLQLSNSRIVGDQHHLFNCFCNLVENSLKYAKDHPVDIWISSKSKYGKVVLTFCDNGPGIAKAHQAHIFERFYRAKKSEEYTTQGFGIGLSYVKSIVEAHQGSITLNPHYTKGCEFIISLPQSK